MKKSENRIYYRVFAIFIILICTLLGLIVYLSKVSISSDDKSVNWTSWPGNFTMNFSDHIYFQQGQPFVTDEGKSELDKYGLCYQIVDENGEVAGGYNEAEGMAHHYAPIDIAELCKSGGTIEDYTEFLGTTENMGEKWTYIIGFPAKISKVTINVNYKNYINLKYIVLVLVLLLMAGVFGYGIWMNHTISSISTKIKALSEGSYVQSKVKGIYRDILSSLNTLDERLKAAEESRKKTETLREEWIANISHDLKTPLSPIRGYAEILCDSGYHLKSEEINKYGNTILKNSRTIENIVENLNFTYQLKNGTIPVNLKTGNILRLIREVIINLLNNPKYENRSIHLNCPSERVEYNFDETLMTRAFTNLIYNSVIHNPEDTVIEVTVESGEDLVIRIKDNGRGMDEEQLQRLFERYYRGTNTSENIKGSGLGMSIAKQIIEAHGGSIKAESVINKGTSIEIMLPKVKL